MSYSDAIWNDWYSVAEPLNKFTPWLTFALSFLWWILYPARPTGPYNAELLVRFLPGFIFGMCAGLFYLVVLQEKIEMRNLENKTLIWLLICFGLSIPTLGGIVIWIQFLLVGILSERPFWKLFTEKGYRVY